METYFLAIMKVPKSSRKVELLLMQFLSAIYLENYEISRESCYDMFDRCHRDKHFPHDKSSTKFSQNC